MEKDLIYQVGFIIHAKAQDGEFDIERAVNNIVRTVEADPRCEVLTSMQGGGLHSYWEGRSTTSKEENVEEKIHVEFTREEFEHIMLYKEMCEATSAKAAILNAVSIALDDDCK